MLEFLEEMLVLFNFLKYMVCVYLQISVETYQPTYVIYSAYAL